MALANNGMSNKERWAQETIAACYKMQAVIDVLRDQFPRDEQGCPIIDVFALTKLIEMEKGIDDIARKAFGLPI